MNAELTVEKNSFLDKMLLIIKKIIKALKNQTFLYIIRRILSSLFTLLLVIALVTALIRLIPDINLYDIGSYNKLKAVSLKAADSYKNSVLFKYGRVTLEGKKVSVFYTIFQYIYWMLPIPKTIPIRWDTRYTQVLENFEGWVFLGRSLYSNPKDVVELLKSRMGISFSISMITVVFTYLLAYPLGVAMAKKPGGLADKLGNAFLVLNYAIPGLVFYLVMNKILGNPDGIFGAFKFSYFYKMPDDGIIRGEQIITLIPPIFCMVFLSIPGTSIWVRRFMVDELSSEYVKFARSKGLSENRIMYTHVLRNAAVPLIRNIPATLLLAIIGSYYVETIWGIPGSGSLLISALKSSKPDVPVVQGLTVIYAALSMSAFLLGDIVTIFFDPRIKLTSK